MAPVAHQRKSLVARLVVDLAQLLLVVSTPLKQIRAA